MKKISHPDSSIRNYVARGKRFYTDWRTLFSYYDYAALKFMLRLTYFKSTDVNLSKFNL